jgi:hypothetical protein
MLRTQKIFLSFMVIWLGAQCLLSTRFPTVFIDEAENANHAYNSARHQKAIFTLYDDLYPQEFYAFRLSWPVTIRPFFVWPLAQWIKGAGFSLRRERLFSVGVLVAVLGLIYASGFFLVGIQNAQIAVVLALTYFPLLYAGHTIRPEILLTCYGIGSFYALLRGERQNAIGWFLTAGLLAGLAPGVHTNGLIFIIPLLFFLGVVRSWRSTLWTGLGWCMGFLFFLREADWDSFFPGYYALFFKEFTTPPWLEWHGQVFKMMVAEFPRYFGPWIFPHWSAGLFFMHVLTVQHVGFIMVLLWGCRQKNTVRFPALFGLGIMMGLAGLVGQKAVNYLAIIAPYFALTTAAWLGDPLLRRAPLERERKGWRPLVRAGTVATGWLIFSGAGIATLFFQAAVASYQPSYLQITQRFGDLMSHHARVAGPQEFWLGLESWDYRDIGALTWHHLLKDEKNLWRPLAIWKPKYLIVNSQMATLLIRQAQKKNQPRMFLPTGFLPWRHHIVDLLKTGPAYGDECAVIEIDSYD